MDNGLVMLPNAADGVLQTMVWGASVREPALSAKETSEKQSADRALGPFGCFAFV